MGTSASALLSDATGESVAPARVTSALFFVCLAAFLGLAIASDLGEQDLVLSWLYRPAYDIWHGSFWTLITSSFVHFDLWHLIGNLYWLWVLGAGVERTLGASRFFVFVVAASFLSSTFELAISDSTGFGASGIVYALVGFIWVARDHHPELRRVLSNQTVALFVLWQIFCFGLTHSGALQIANTAHISGFVFGALAGGLAASRSRRVVAGCLGLLSIAALLVLFWCPWSPTFVGGLAYEAHEHEEYDRALQLYTEVIRLDPDNAWAYYNRSDVHASLGDVERATADRVQAAELDPRMAADDGDVGGE